jgi:hypothetical protein
MFIFGIGFLLKAAAAIGASGMLVGGYLYHRIAYHLATGASEHSDGEDKTVAASIRSNVES